MIRHEALTPGVGGDADCAEFGAGCELGEHGHEPDAKLGTVGSAAAHELMNRMLAFAPA